MGGLSCQKVILTLMTLSDGVITNNIKNVCVLAPLRVKTMNNL